MEQGFQHLEKVADAVIWINLHKNSSYLILLILKKLGKNATRSFPLIVLLWLSQLLHLWCQQLHLLYPWLEVSAKHMLNVTSPKNKKDLSLNENRFSSVFSSWEKYLLHQKSGYIFRRVNLRFCQRGFMCTHLGFLFLCWDRTFICSLVFFLSFFTSETFFLVWWPLVLKAGNFKCCE